MEFNFEKFRKQIDAILDLENGTENIFKILRQETYENKHSTFLSWLLNPKASHGFGKDFAESFFKKALGKNKIEADKIKRIYTEKCIDGDEQKKRGNDRRRIDILIVGDKFTCTIENKYGSSAHGGQCADYREYIEGRKNKTDKQPSTKGKYPRKDWNNYFIFLDVEEPPNFEEEHRDCYADYAFISYKQIMAILEKLVEKKEENITTNKEENITTTFVKQYIEILDEKYTPLNKKYTEICEEIDIKDILKIIKIKNYKDLSYEYQKFIDVVKKYYDQIFNTINNKILPILKQMVDDKYIKEDYGRGKYAKTIEFSDLENPMFQTVDYRAPMEEYDNISIAIVSGATKPYSVNLCNYLCSVDFVERYNKLPEKGKWDIKLKLWIHNGAGGMCGEFPVKIDEFIKMTQEDRECILNNEGLAKSISFEDFFLKDDFWNTLINLKVKEIIDEATYNNICTLLREYFITKSIEKLKEYYATESKEDLKKYFETKIKENVMKLIAEKLIADDTYRKKYEEWYNKNINNLKNEYEYSEYKNGLKQLLNCANSDEIDQSIKEDFELVLKYKAFIAPIIQWKKEELKNLKKEIIDKYRDKGGKEKFKELKKKAGKKTTDLTNVPREEKDYILELRYLLAINDESNKEITGGWILPMVYVLADSELENMEDTFRKKTIDGLTVLNYEEAFKKLMRS